MIGFLLIDKPEGISSFDCIRKLRKVLNIRRMGFVGTLDPLATGLLLFAVGEATKLIPYLEGRDKTYEAIVRFGVVSNTYDAEGTIEPFLNPSEPSSQQIEELLKVEFLGERQQIPPQFSAIHIDGKRAYELARKDEMVDLKSRKVIFHTLTLSSYTWPQASFVVHCGSGTYIRSFAHDLGQKLHCGGYVEKLRRTKIDSYSVENAVKLDDFCAEDAQKCLIAPEKFLHDWVHISLNDQEYEYMSQGGFIPLKPEKKEADCLALYKGRCVGILEEHLGQLKFKKRFILSE